MQGRIVITKVLRIKDDSEHYLISGLGHCELRKVHETFSTTRAILAQSSTNESVKELWKPVDFSMNDATRAQKGAKMPDIALWKCGFILHQRAYQCDDDPPLRSVYHGTV